jgi:type IV pilus assembly protein PilB
MANLQRMTKRKLGEVLLREQLVTREQVEEALNEQGETGEFLGEILVRKGYVSERDIAETIATQYSFPYLEPDQYYISTDVLQLLPLEFMQRHLVIPLDRFGQILTVVTSGPLDPDVVSEIEQITGCKVQVFISIVSEVRKTIDSLEEGRRRAAARQDD